MNFDISNIQENFNTFYEDIKFGIEASINSSEEKLKTETERRILDYLKTFGIDLTSLVQYESSELGLSKIQGRMDALYGTVIIEYKKYALLDSEKELKKALKQLKDKYLEKVSLNVREKYIGILFDGKTIVFYKYNNDVQTWIEEKEQFSRDSLYTWLLYLSGAVKKEVSPSLLKNDFSLNKSIPINFVNRGVKIGSKKAA